MYNEFMIPYTAEQFLSMLISLAELVKHPTSNDSHKDIRMEISNINDRLNTVLNSDDEELDQMKEMVDYIKNNKSLIDSITLAKLSVTDVVDDLLTNVSTKPLSAKQGVILKQMIANIVIPTTLSEFLTDPNHRTVTDAEKVVWNNKSNFSGKYEDLEGKPTIPSKPSDIGAESSGTSTAKVSEHNVSDTSHNDLRILIQDLSTRLNTLANSDDTTLDQMSEIVAYIKNNKNLIDGVTTNKVSVADIVDNLETNVYNKPLSAKQGMYLRAMIEDIIVPTKLSQLQNDVNFMTSVPTNYVTSDVLNNRLDDVKTDSASKYAQKAHVHDQYLTKVPDNYVTNEELTGATSECAKVANNETLTFIMENGETINLKVVVVSENEPN